MSDLGSIDREGVQMHLSLLQGIIQRMARNSLHVKTWCIALVSAILALAGQKEKLNLGLIALLPILLFLLMDGYYLALERCFRFQYDELVKKWSAGELMAADLYRIHPCRNLPLETLRAIRSFAVWPFYIILAAVVGIILIWTPT